MNQSDGTIGSLKEDEEDSDEEYKSELQQAYNQESSRNFSRKIHLIEKESTKLSKIKY